MMKSRHYIAIYLLLCSCTGFQRQIGRNYNNDTLYFKAELNKLEVYKYKEKPYHIVIELNGNDKLMCKCDSLVWFDNKKMLRVLQRDSTIKVYGDSTRVYQRIKGTWQLIKEGI